MLSASIRIEVWGHLGRTIELKQIFQHPDQLRIWISNTDG